jgi:hypothetical protein
MTRHEALFEWIGSYPKIHDIYTFDFGKAKVDSNLFKLISEETVKKDILGEETVQYKFGIGEYKFYDLENPFSNENRENVEAVDEFIEWVREQDKLRNYPVIENAEVIQIRAVRTGSGIDSVDPIMRLAQYAFTVIVTYTRR